MSTRVSFFLALLISIQGASAAEPPVRFTEQVAPILVKNCLGCHNGKKAESGLDLSTFASLKKGGKLNGDSILVKGDAAKSELVLSVLADADPRMPYKLPPLSEAGIEVLKRWVNEGAKFDAASETETSIASLVDPLKGLPAVKLTAKVLDPVNTLAFSPDGSTLVAGAGRDLLVYDVGTGKERSRIATALGIVNVVRFAEDGRTLIAAGGRAGMFGGFAVYDLTKAESKATFESKNHRDAVLTAEISPDGKTIATGGYDRFVLLTDLEGDHKVKATLKDHTDAVHALAFRPDGAWLASAGADRTVKVWDVAKAIRLKTLGDSKAELYAVAFGIDPETILAGGVDRTLRIWKLSGNDSHLVNSAFAHDGAILNIKPVSRTGRIVTSSDDRTVKVWDLDTLSERRTLAKQADWPQAVAVDKQGQRLAVGRADGSLSLVDLETGKTIHELRNAQPEAAPAVAATLSRNATLNPPSPRGVAVGTTVRMVLTGEGIGAAVSVIVPEGDVKGAIVPLAPNAPGDPNRIDLELTIDPKARVGLHSLGLITPTGTTPFQTFAVEAAPAVDEIEPNSTIDTPQGVPRHSTVIGKIEQPGDRDHFAVEARQGEPITLKTTTRSLGSSLQAVLRILDPRGKVIAESSNDPSKSEPLLTTAAPTDGRYTIEVTDADYGGSSGHFYRLAIGSDAVFDSFFPLAVAAGRPTTIKVDGSHLQGVTEAVVNPPKEMKGGAFVEVPVVLDKVGTLAQPRRSALIVDGPQALEHEPNDNVGQAPAIAAPSGSAGTIDRPGDTDYFRFESKKGQTWIIEVYGGRLGSPIDAALEVLDESGKSLPRAILRPLSQTEVAFRDHNASSTGIRLTKWDTLAINDIVMIGREVTRIFNLPRNADDDCQFWSEDGRRAGWLETTPEYHPMGELIYKVDVLEPGSPIPTGGLSPTPLYYRNDDGGPAYQKDARLTFKTPADGSYIVKVNDARGSGGEAFHYHLVVRAPAPDFRLSVSNENPNIPRGGTTLLTASIDRLDGFDGAVDVRVENLPPGVHATATRIEPFTNSAVIGLTADLDAPAFSKPTWSLIAAAADPPALQHELDPGGGNGGWITVTPLPNFRVEMTPPRVLLRPGGDVQVTLNVDRGIGYAGRIPFSVSNLPQGVQVLNIGLNGVLIREQESERTITLHAEPWVKPQERPFFGVGRAESAGTDHSSAASILVIVPDSNETPLRENERRSISGHE